MAARWKTEALPVAAGLLLGGGWLAVSLYFLYQLQSADTLRTMADQVQIDLLETRRREKDFLLRSVYESNFHLTGTSPSLELHHEALGKLTRSTEALAARHPRQLPLVDKRRLYSESFDALVAAWRRRGWRGFGLEGSMHAHLDRLEKDLGAAPPAGLALELSGLQADEGDYLLHSDEIDLRRLHVHADRLRSQFRSALPDRAADCEKQLDAYLQDLAALRAVQIELGLTENLGLQGRLRTAAHDIEPLVARVVAETSTDYAAAAGRLLTGFGTASILLSLLLAAVFVQSRTARRQARDLKDFSSELTRSNAELQQFAYVASHDLQEPLRAVAGCVQLLEQRAKGQIDAKSDEYIRHAVEGCLRMQALIEDLLALSRIGAKSKPPVPTDCGPVLQAAIANLAVPVRESGAAVTNDPLPVIPMDPTLMAQVFQNLIANAIKFRSPSRTPAVHVSAARDGKAWRFSVKDNGIGIEKQYFERIFRVFQRLHTREEFPGSGIGLAVCEKIVVHHGGRIWLESEVDRGTTFYFTVPDAV